MSNTSSVIINNQTHPPVATLYLSTASHSKKSAGTYDPLTALSVSVGSMDLHLTSVSGHKNLSLMPRTHYMVKTHGHITLVKQQWRPSHPSEIHRILQSRLRSRGVARLRLVRGWLCGSGSLSEHGGRMRMVKRDTAPFGPLPLTESPPCVPADSKSVCPRSLPL